MPVPGSHHAVRTRNLANYFDKSPQRKEKLDGVVRALDLPSIVIQNYPETRVAYVVILFRSLLANHFVLKSFIGDKAEEAETFKKGQTSER